MPTHLKSFDIVGKKDAISDYIALIDPSDTPFLSSIKSEKITNTYFQWMEDQLRAPAKNAKLEGADAVDTDRDQPSMRFNGTQILTETFRVSGTSEAVKMYGRDSVVARETMKTGKVTKMDLEHSLVGTGQTYVAATASVEGEFAGVQAQIHADTTSDNGGTGRALTEVLVVDTHEKLYNAGSDATILMVKPNDARTISDFQADSSRTVNQDADAKKITKVVNVYESPFGTVRVVKNRRLRATDALMYDPKSWKLVTLRNWFREKLAKNGDSDRWMVVGEFSLKHMHQKMSALITDLN